MGTYFYTYDVTQEPDWVTVVEEGTKLTLTVAALPEGAELRGAAILVIPEVIWNKIKILISKQLYSLEIVIMAHRWII